MHYNVCHGLKNGFVFFSKPQKISTVFSEVAQYLLSVHNSAQLMHFMLTLCSMLCMTQSKCSLLCQPNMLEPTGMEKEEADSEGNSFSLGK